MSDEIAQVLAATLSSENNARIAAELRLSQLSASPGAQVWATMGQNEVNDGKRVSITNSVWTGPLTTHYLAQRRRDDTPDKFCNFSHGRTVTR